MEPQYSVLIFSKYSPNCKRIFDMVSNSGIEFDNTIGKKLQLLCVDNIQVRQRIKNNSQLDVSSVPCILSVFQNGGVEKYDGGHAFAWIENLISKYVPQKPPVPSLPQQSTIPVQPQESNNSQEEHVIQVPPQEIPLEEKKRSRSKIRYEERQIPIPRRMKPEQDEIDENRSTSIDDIPIEEDSDRHRNIPQPRRIRQDKDKYIEDENLFSGELPDNREPSKIKPSASERIKGPDSAGLRAKAEELARGREDIDKQFGSPKERPISDRRP